MSNHEGAKTCEDRRKNELDAHPTSFETGDPGLTHGFGWGHALGLGRERFVCDGASRNDHTLKDVNVSGVYLVGGAVGLQFMNCPVSDIHLVGNNHLSGMQGIGGIVGTGFDLISECSATAEITVLGDDGACAGLIAGGTSKAPCRSSCPTTWPSSAACATVLGCGVSQYGRTLQCFKLEIEAVEEFVLYSPNIL